MELNFGRGRSSHKEGLENIAESYIASFFRYGQLRGEYLLAWAKGQLTCQTLMARSGVERPQLQSGWSNHN